MSQNAEEWLVRDFFRDRHGGVFLDVGASSYKEHSTTYTLEVALGWSGVAVEPQPQFAADYARFRPRTRFVQAFASDRPGTTTLYIPNGSTELASADPNYVGSPRLGETSIQVPMLTLDSILRSAGLDRIDFMSMDIENAEPQGLAGFDIRHFAPELVCIESHYAVRQAILDYFASHGYVLVGKYWHVDLVNMYFMPLRAAVPGSPADQVRGTP